MADIDWEQDKAEFMARPADAPHPEGDAEASPLARQFAQLARLLLNADTVADVLTLVVHVTFKLVPDADLVSMTLRSADGHLHTPAGTDPLATELDELQEHYQEGPCYDAARLPGITHTHSPHLAADPRWPQFGPKAVGHGFYSVLSTALLRDVTSPRLSGALNIYSRDKQKLGDDTTLDRALLLATHASLAVANTEAVRVAELREIQLRRALDTRDVIGQAKGILMRHRGISADEAFDVLRRTSQDLNVKLVTLAETLTTRHSELELPR
jgi:hypothetical protein